MEGTFAQIGTTDTTAFIDTMVAAGESYSYFVIANYSDGTEAASNHVAALIPENAALAVSGFHKAYHTGKALPKL
jgi:hypothetical protein